VVILRGGHTVAKRYAPGYGPETPQIGWSVTLLRMNSGIEFGQSLYGD
jgi:hypothetical protein